jgi:hypothetical protein
VFGSNRGLFAVAAGTLYLVLTLNTHSKRATNWKPDPREEISLKLLIRRKVRIGAKRVAQVFDLVAITNIVGARPQSLNLYSYVENGPVNRIDPDGHEGEGGGGDGGDSGGQSTEKPGGAATTPSTDCKQVTVAVAKYQDAHEVTNKEQKDRTGNVVANKTGVEGKLIDTVKVNGKAASGVSVTEDAPTVDTKNGTVVDSTTSTGHGNTNANGQVFDTLGIYHPTDGSAATNGAVLHDFASNLWTSTDRQTLSMTFKDGVTCLADMTRTLTNIGPNGPSSSYNMYFP